MLLNCVAYQNGIKLADISVEEISDYLERKDCFVWVALRDTTDVELDKMQEEFGLHDLAIEDAHHGHQRPKIEEYGDELFVVLHIVEASAQCELTVGEMSIFVGSNFILSIRNRSSQDFQEVRGRCFWRTGGDLDHFAAPGGNNRRENSAVHHARATRWSRI